MNSTATMYAWGVGVSLMFAVLWFARVKQDGAGAIWMAFSFLSIGGLFGSMAGEWSVGWLIFFGLALFGCLIGEVVRRVQKATAIPERKFGSDLPYKQTCTRSKGPYTLSLPPGRVGG